MEKYIDNDGVRIFYDVIGENKKAAVVFVHGFGIDRDMWKRQLPALKDYLVICIDARGHGKSRPCSDFTVLKVCEDIRAILDNEGCGGAAIIGLSMGSYVAQEFARLYPHITKGILAADGTPIYIKYPLWERIGLKWSAPMLALYSWDRLKIAMAKQSSVKEDVRDELILMFDKQTKEEFISSWAGIANVLHEEDVKIDCPFYAVCGTQDKTGTVRAHMKDWKQTYPNCEVRMIQDAGHVSNMDNPEEFNRIMLEFLSKVYTD